MRTTKILKILFVVTIIIIAGYSLYNDVSNSSARKSMEQQLLSEYKSIHTFAGEQGQLNGFSVKSSNAIIVYDFTTLAPYKEIKKYYDNELSILGWKYIDETVNQYGAKIASYRKGKFVLKIEYYGPNVPNRPQYYLSIIWIKGQ